MSRYKSSQRWQKVVAGCYDSPDHRYQARRQPRVTGKAWKWDLYREDREGWPTLLGTHLTLADCQEHAERIDANQPIGG